MALIWTEDKLDVLVTYLKNGLCIKDIAKKFNTSMDAVYAAVRRYDLGEYSLNKKSSTPKFLETTDFTELDDNNFQEAKNKAKLIWNVAKPRKGTSKRSKLDIALFFPDTHIPHHNVAACKAITKLMDDIKFNKFVIMGDFMDLGCIGHWDRNKHRTLELRRLKNDYIIGNALLDEFDSRLTKDCEKHYLGGNHEEWADHLLEEMPQLEGLVEPKSMLKLAERNYKFHDYNELVKFGRLYATHGIYAGANPIKKHLDELKVNVIFGHTHTLGMRLASSAAREIAFAGYNIGCTCDLSPSYMRNRPNSWTHGFAVGYFYPDGYFDVQLIRIVKGKFIFNNKVYDGNV